MRNLILILGDQLDRQSTALDGFDRSQDLVWMAEVSGEATQVWSHKCRIALFFSAMRHFCAALRKRRYRVRYHRLQEHDRHTLNDVLEEDLRANRPQRLVVTEPGEYRVRRMLEALAERLELTLEVREDRHFYISPVQFDRWAGGRRELRMENFYRRMRRHLSILMHDNGEPVGGQWNFDKRNRKAFGKRGPGQVPGWRSFTPDKITREVIALVEQEFADHPGDLAAFDWPVTREQALQALADFIDRRLGAFGRYQDALWDTAPNLYHSRLSSAINLKLLDPREAVNAAADAYRNGQADIASVEGFVRQIVGWREFVRGLYWRFMPDWEQWNALDARANLPPLYWSGEVDMRCLAVSVGDTLRYGYAHHIQRLMITGLFALLYGVEPSQIHQWYLAIYVDAVEWVELPNVLGMSQYADGGVMGSKPYVASGRYISKMSNYCTGCRYDPGNRSGDDACPFTTLYWDFLQRHEQRFSNHPRTALQWQHVQKMSTTEKHNIHRHAEKLRERYGG